MTSDDASSSGSATSDATASAEVQPTDPTPPRRGIRWPKTGVILTTIVTIIGTVASLIVVFDILARDRTNFSHLMMSAQFTDDAITDWAIPGDALDTFPADGQACGPAQLAWLERHGTQMHRRLMLSVRNNPSEGAMLALTDFRTTAPRAAERGPISIRLVCDPQGAPAGRLVYVRLDADDATLIARHVRVVEDTTTVATPEMPLAYNLAPGESGLIPIELFSRNPAEGSIAVTVLSGSEERIETIAGSDFTMPALLFTGDMHLHTTKEGLSCRRITPGGITPCTMEELLFELQTAR